MTQPDSMTSRQPACPSCTALRQQLAEAEMMRDQKEAYHKGAWEALREAGFDGSEPVPAVPSLGAALIRLLTQQRNEARQQLAQAQQERDEHATNCSYSFPDVVIGLLSQERDGYQAQVREMQARAELAESRLSALTQEPPKDCSSCHEDGYTEGEAAMLERAINAVHGINGIGRDQDVYLREQVIAALEKLRPEAARDTRTPEKSHE